MRQTYNRFILGKLEELVNKYPDWRFGQILDNCGLLELATTDNGSIVSVKDPFYEESIITWNRIKDYGI